MAWLQFILETNQKKAETYSEYFIEAGAVAVTLQDAQDHAIFEPQVGTTPLWNHTRVIGLFDANINIESVKERLKKHLPDKIFQTLQIMPLEDQNWTTAWMDRFHPMQFGKRLWIYPSWSEPPIDSNITIVQLDPGMAFGTGTHATTALCLEWLDQHLLEKSTVIDYGCGSGILGIAALKLGAAKVYAIDNDPQALLSTQDNAQKNGFSEKNIMTFLPDEFKILQKAQSFQKVDLLVANILAYPLLELASTFAEFVKRGGQIVLSGILEKQQDVIVEGYSTWFTKIEILSREEWIRVSAIRM
jgi:ribosomal protein L11 methyltransferase